MTLPKVPKQYFGDFLRGYFDGDGNVWTGSIHKERKTSTDVIQVFFTSGSVTFLRKLCTALQSQGIKGGGLYVPKSECFGRLIFSTNDALKIFEILYTTGHKLYLKRKKIVFKQFMKLRS